MAEQADIVIIGGGMWGSSTAWHLARQGGAGRVVVLERSTELADETTRAAAGQIGQLRSTPLMSRAVGYTLALMTQLKELTGYDPGIRTPGSLHLALNPDRLDAFRSQLPVATAAGIRVDFADPAFIRSIAPVIDADRLDGAIYVHGDGYVDARAAARAFAMAAIDAGVDFLCGSRVRRIETRRGAIAAVHTDTQTIETSTLLIAAGPWTAHLAASLGVNLPCFGVRLQQVRTVPTPLVTANHPVVRIPDLNSYLRPERGGFLFGTFEDDPLAIDPRDPGRADMTTRDIDPPVGVMNESTRRLAPHFPALAQLDVDERRQGMITATPDASYILGPVERVSGLYVATGCGAMGIAGSGAVGRWLANWILTGHPGDDLAGMSPDRFADRADDIDWLRDEARRVCASYYALGAGSQTYSVGVR